MRLLRVKKYVFIFSIISLSFLLTGCKKNSWFDQKPDLSLAIPTTLKDFQAVMDDAEALTSLTPGLGEAASDGHYVSDATFESMSPLSRNAYTWSHDVPYTNVFEWNLLGQKGAYPKIFICNVVLEGLSKFIPADDLEAEKANDIKAQALFYRAKSFFEVADVFAPPYNPSTATTDLGIPLRLESDAQIPSVRATVQQTYDQIIGDLMIAKDLISQNALPTSPLMKCRPTLPAVLALLSRIYLSMEEYTQAGNFADQALSKYNALLDFKVDSTSALEMFNAEVILHSTMSTQFAAARRSTVLIDSNWYNLYDTNDRRRALYFKPNASTGIVAYRGGYAGSASLFSGLAVDELYLIRAEAAARNGNKDIAMNDLNTILVHRWADDSYVPLGAVDAAEALDKVLLERKKELILRGLRWTDLRRLNRDDKFKVIITRVTPTGTYTLEPNTFKYTFPIPADVIQLSGMPQNVGW